MLLPTRQAVQKRGAARAAAEIMAGPTLPFAHTEAEAASPVVSDIDDNDTPLCTAERIS